MLTQETRDAYCALLHRELIPATGCTEPIAIAYAAAVMRETLGELPDRLRVAVSGSSPCLLTLRNKTRTLSFLLETISNLQS